MCEVFGTLGASPTCSLGSSRERISAGSTYCEMDSSSAEVASQRVDLAACDRLPRLHRRTPDHFVHLLTIRAGLGGHRHHRFGPGEGTERPQVLRDASLIDSQPARRREARGQRFRPCTAALPGRIVRRLALSSSVRSSIFVAAFATRHRRMPESRASDPMRSERTGLRLNGIVELPTWRSPKGSNISPIAGDESIRTSNANFESDAPRPANADSSRYRACADMFAS